MPQSIIYAYNTIIYKSYWIGSLSRESRCKNTYGFIDSKNNNAL